MRIGKQGSSNQTAEIWTQRDQQTPKQQKTAGLRARLATVVPSLCRL